MANQDKLKYKKSNKKTTKKTKSQTKRWLDNAKRTFYIKLYENGVK